jgi:hypothetical protein
VFRNYWMAALRNLSRNRFYTGISITGLSIGLCAVLLAAPAVSTSPRTRAISAPRRTHAVPRRGNRNYGSGVPHAPTGRYHLRRRRRATDNVALNPRKLNDRLRRVTAENARRAPPFLHSLPVYRYSRIVPL